MIFWAIQGKKVASAVTKLTKVYKHILHIECSPNVVALRMEHCTSSPQSHWFNSHKIVGFLTVDLFVQLHN